MERRSPALAGEIVLLLLAAPLLYLPNWLPPWAPFAGLALLALLLPWRRWAAGCWWTRTWADWPLLLLFAVMLPIAVWAAPEPLRQQYALPRTYILLWNLALFSTIVTYASRSYSVARACVFGLLLAASAVALLAPLGMNWLYKLSFLNPVLNAIPRPLLGIFRGAEGGFSPNQVAGALLYALPLALTWTILGYRQRRTGSWRLFLITSLLMGATLLLSQSRGALIGLIAGLALALLLALPRGGWLAAAAAAAAALSAPLWLESLLQLAYGGNEYLSSAAMNLDWRQEVWQRGLEAVHEFPLTGIGFGAFRQASRWLYPFYKVAPDYDLAHAHNIFLQTALDFGVPGLIALLAIYAGMFAALLQIARAQAGAAIPHQRIWALSFTAALIAQTVYSMSDAVAMGSKPNFFFWWLLALLAAFSNLAHHPPSQQPR